MAVSSRKLLAVSTICLSWNRKTHVMRWSCEFWYEHSDGVSEETLDYLTARGGGVRMLLRRGCLRSFPRA